MSLFIQHLPHIAPVVVVWGMMWRYWRAERQRQRVDAAAQAARGPSSPDGAGGPAPASSSAVVPRGSAPAPSAVAAPVRPASASRAAASPSGPTTTVVVRRSVAIRALVALGPVTGALGTGLVLYGMDISDAQAGWAAIWIHVGISLLALLLVIYKIADIGARRIRASLRGRDAWRAIVSLVLLAAWVPLLLTGVVLLIEPSTASFAAYTHLIASAWWTGLLLWHLRRYLVRAVRASRAPSDQPGRTAAPVRSRAVGRSL